MFSTPKSSAARRTLARVAVAGALTAIPLTALAIPASAEVNAEAQVTEVRHWRDCDDFGPFRDWNCRDRFDPWRNNDWRDDWRSDRHRPRHDPFWQFFRGSVPRGSFGSS